MSRDVPAQLKRLPLLLGLALLALGVSAPVASALGTKDSSVRFGAFPKRVDPGKSASITLNVRPFGQRCTLTVRYANGKRQPNLKGVTAATGRAVWRWRVSPATPSGPAKVVAICPSGRATRTFPVVAAPVASTVRWEFDGSAWKAIGGQPPACPTPLLRSPVELGLATSVLYPGQTRGTYKPHGGFRFDGLANSAVSVRAPLDSLLVRGSRYLVEGEIQYSLDFIAPCGIMIRLGHLLALPPDLAAAVEKFPPAVEGDSRTEQFNPAIRVVAGQQIATAVGLTKGANTFVDLGVYDLRGRNTASQNPAWLQEHGGELAPYAVCWFDLLPADAAARVKSLPPADQAAGTTSDYCR